MVRKGRARERGFTLLEVLVAFVIAALAMAVLFRAGGSGLFAAKAAGQYQEALARARSHLAAVGRDAALSAGTRSGDDGGGYRWRVSVLPIAVQQPAAPDAETARNPTRPPLALYSVEVGISWGTEGRPREVVLKTARLGRAVTRP